MATYIHRPIVPPWTVTEAFAYPENQAAHERPVFSPGKSWQHERMSASHP